MPINGPILFHWPDLVGPNLAVLFRRHMGEKIGQTGSERARARPMKKRAQWINELVCLWDLMCLPQQ